MILHTTLDFIHKTEKLELAHLSIIVSRKNVEIFKIYLQ